MNAQTFQLTLEQRFSLSAQSIEIESASLHAIQIRLLKQMEILMYQDNATRLIIKGDRQTNPFDLNDAQQFELELMKRALPDLQREKAIELFKQSLQISQVKRNVLKAVEEKFNAA